MEKALVDIFTAASIVSAAVFGALGLFTEYRKDGKVTRYGKIAVAGILASAVISLLVNFLQNRIEADADAKASNRFNDQLARLERINVGLGKVAAGTAIVQGQVETNLKTTGDAASGVKRSLRATKAVQQSMVRSLWAQNVLQIDTRRGFDQERKNTEAVLRTMWSDANRVYPSSFEVVLAYDCGDPTKLKALIGGRSEATFRMMKAGTNVSLERLEQRAGEREPDDPSLEEVGYDAPISLFSDTFIYDNTVPVSVFNRFISPNLGDFAGLEAWRGGFVEIFVNIAAADLASAMVPFQRGDSPPGPATPVSVKGAPTEWHRLPCSDVFMTFLVNGRQFASGDGTIYHKRNKLMVRSKPLAIENVPVFALDRIAERAGR